MTTVLVCSVTNYGSHPYVTFLFYKVDWYSWLCARQHTEHVRTLSTL